MQKVLLIVGAVVIALGGLLLVLSGGDDDGAGVRTVGDCASGSASGSSSGSAPASGSPAASGSSSGSGSEPCPSGSASAPASGSGSGTAAKCEAVGDLATATTTVSVTLDEWVIDLAQASTTAGQVGFALENEGEDPHEFVVIQGVAADALPLDADGALDESKLPDGALIGEVEPFPSGGACDGTFALTPGDYVFVCNISEIEPNGELESHLKEGMLTTFTVT